jgi:hypothetical protein
MLCEPVSWPVRTALVHWPCGQEAASQMRAYRVILWVFLSIIIGVVLVVAIFWVYAIVTGGKNF